MRPVALHMVTRIENERWVYSSFCAIDCVRARVRVMGVSAVGLSAISLGLPVGIMPRPRAGTSTDPTISARMAGLQFCQAQWLR